MSPFHSRYTCAFCTCHCFPWMSWDTNKANVDWLTWERADQWFLVAYAQQVLLWLQCSYCALSMATLYSLWLCDCLWRSFFRVMNWKMNSHTLELQKRIAIPSNWRSLSCYLSWITHNLEPTKCVPQGHSRYFPKHEDLVDNLVYVCSLCRPLLKVWGSLNSVVTIGRGV